MAKENGAPTAAEKGKGKMEDEKPSKSPKKQDDVKKDKDGKPIANGKPDEEPLEGRLSGRWLDGVLLTGYVQIEELSEEDQSLKNELEMLVARLHVCFQLWLLQILNAHADGCFSCRNRIPASTYLRWMPSKIS